MLKKFIYVTFFFAFLVVSFACEKHSTKFCVEEVIPSTTHLIPDTTLSQMGDRIQQIESYGSFQIRQYDKNSNADVAKCNQFYKGLPVFSNDVNFVFSNVQGLVISGDLVKSIDVDFEPKVSFTKAAKIAHKEINAEECYKATLGLYDLNQGTGNHQTNFRLVWKIYYSNYNFPFAIIDAQKGDILANYFGVLLM